MPRRLSILAAAIMGLSVSHGVLAELYISPVLKNPQNAQVGTENNVRGAGVPAHAASQPGSFNPDDLPVLGRSAPQTFGQPQPAPTAQAPAQQPVAPMGYGYPFMPAYGQPGA